MNGTHIRWTLAWLYFGLIIAISHAAGTIQFIIENPLGIIGPQSTERELLLWLASTMAIAFFTFIGYWVVWTGWTNTKTRKFSLISIIGFGLPWGICDSFICISLWRLAKYLLPLINAPNSVAIMVAAAVTLNSAIDTPIHVFFLDRYVSPDHNRLSTNTLKVLYVHVPFIIMVLTFMTIFQSPVVVVFAYTAALTGSSFGMRFPAPWAPAEPWPTPDPTFADISKTGGADSEPLNVIKITSDL